LEPLPFVVYERDEKTKEFKINKQKSMLSKSAFNSLPDEYNKFSQRDRDEFIKNIELAETMDRLIKFFRSRDTKGNIKRL
jgi:hypothetical protein